MDSFARKYDLSLKNLTFSELEFIFCAKMSILSAVEFGPLWSPNPFW